MAVPGPSASDRPAPIPVAGAVHLTPRESDVLRLASRGLGNAEVGAVLHLSETTVKTHMRHVLAKLGAAGRTHAVALGYESGLLASPAVEVAVSARALLLEIPRCPWHPPAQPPGACRDCVRWSSARRVVAGLDAALAGGAS